MDNNSVKLESIDAKCPNCGNNLKYSPKDGALKCGKCGTKQFIEYSQVNKKMPYDNLNDEDLLKWQKEVKYIKCKSCGSSVGLKNNEISLQCPYCDSQNIVLQKDIKGLYPNFIIGFAFDKKEASRKFVEQVKKKFMAPRKFKKELPENQIDGFYFPSFSFDAKSASSYSGTLYRYETVGAGNNTQTRIEYFSIRGNVNLVHKDVLVESSSRLSQFELHNLLPYDFSKSADFKPEYLFGYKVEQYNEQFKCAVARNNEICKEQVRESILRKYDYDGVSELNINSIYSDKYYGYYMMPVYTFEYKYKNKKYLTFMNGQTGKVGSGLPVSKVKVTIGIILSVLIVLIPILLILFLGGD